MSLVALDLEVAELAKWIVDRGADFDPKNPLAATINGLICGLPADRSAELIENVMKQGRTRGWDAKQVGRFLLLAPMWRTTWNTVAACGADVEKAYWAKARPAYWSRQSNEDFEYALDHLLTVGRPRSALSMCCHQNEGHGWNPPCRNTGTCSRWSGTGCHAPRLLAHDRSRSEV